MSQYKGSKTTSGTINSPVLWSWKRAGGVAEQIRDTGPFGTLKKRASLLRDNWDDVEIRKVSGDMYELVAARNAEDYTETFEITGNEFTESLTKSPKLIAEFTELGVSSPEDLLSQIELIVDQYKGEAGSMSRAAMRAKVAALAELQSASDEADALAGEVADEIDRSGNAYLQAQYIFTHTLVVPDWLWHENAEYFANQFLNTHRIFTEDQMRQVEGVPESLKIPQSVIDPNTPSEWLKGLTRSSLTNLRRSIVTTYTSADRISRVRYKLAAL